MSTSVDKTEFILTARDETKAAFQSAKTAMDGLKASALAVAPALGGLSIGFLLKELGGVLNDAINFTAALDDMAESTGATVENLSALSAVAKIGGHDLGAIETALQRLSKTLANTDDETKGAGKALAALGLNIDDLRLKDPADAMLVLAKALDGVKDGSGKTAAAMAILGKSGAQMLPFLKDLATTGNLVTKVTAEQAAQAEAYQKSMKALEASFGDVARAAAIDLLPTLSKVSGEMAAAVNASGGFGSYIKNVFGLASGSIADNIDQVSKKVSEIEDRISIGRAGKGDEDELKRLQSRLQMLKAIDDQRKQIMASGLGIDDIAAPKTNLDGIDLTTEDRPKKGKTGAAKQVDEATRLIESLREQVAMKQLDLESTDKLTSAEEQAAKVRYQLEAGTLKATDAQRESISAALDNLTAIEKQVTAQKEWTDAVASQEQFNTKMRQQMFDQIIAAERAVEIYGLSESAITAMAIARAEDTLAMLNQTEGMQEQAAELESFINLQRRLATAQDKGDLARLIAATASAKKAKEEADKATLDRALAAGDISPKIYEEAKAAMDAVGELDEFTKQAARNMQDAMAEFFIDPTKDGIEGLAVSFGQTVQKMIAQAGSAQLMNLLFGDMGKTGEVGGWAKSLLGLFSSSGTSAASSGFSAADLAFFENFAFADGGIMTSGGPLPLRKYATGGIATTPQMALFGEGSTPEAYVPVPSGKIPVELKGGTGGVTVTQHIVVNGNGDRAEIRRAAASGARSVLGVVNTSRRYS